MNPHHKCTHQYHFGIFYRKLKSLKYWKTNKTDCPSKNPFAQGNIHIFWIIFYILIFSNTVYIIFYILIYILNQRPETVSHTLSKNCAKSSGNRIQSWKELSGSNSFVLIINSSRSRCSASGNQAYVHGKEIKLIDFLSISHWNGSWITFRIHRN